MQRFRGGLVFKARRLCVSLNSRLESNKEEEDARVWSGVDSMDMRMCPAPPAIAFAVWRRVQSVGFRVGEFRGFWLRDYLRRGWVAGVHSEAPPVPPYGPPRLGSLGRDISRRKSCQRGRGLSREDLGHQHTRFGQHLLRYIL